MPIIAHKNVVFMQIIAHKNVVFVPIVAHKNVISLAYIIENVYFCLRIIFLLKNGEKYLSRISCLEKQPKA